ncbi:DUF2690 domain-containing protein [Streptomyces sp. 549]|uniref:helix-turn-helix domain-containing protein n=1 Tax=Streptomyces sp. 549 TaxID=3049076 RepID=UPI0024C436F3|nr:XRE family transcriptional regulator [Streptomyces sp. 549]MDK1472771.1 DUF2690 domain-containing protein [Streptomyces sp. 549]
MPRWKALPEELDPEISEFAHQLRRVVDRSGLSLAAVSDRTGYSRTSWERYLNGRLLPPQGAISALAEATRTDVGHLATMWELAERAWSRAEMRHDMTMEAIRISQAREALAKTGSTPIVKKPRGRTAKPAAQRSSVAAGHASGSVRTAPESFEHTAVLRRQSPAPQRTANGTGPAAQFRAPEPPGPAARPAPSSRAGRGGKPSGARRGLMFLAGVAGALAVIGVAFFFLDLGGSGQAAPEPEPVPTKVDPKLPAGVECTGADCAGKDPETMGCGGQYAETTSDAMIGNAYIEVRYSDVCKAAWARVTDAEPGATVRITAHKKSQTDEVGENTDGYTKMVAAKTDSSARVCLEGGTGPQGCTTAAE